MTMIYGWDSVFASKEHSVASRLRASGGLYAIRTSEIIERCARSEIVELDQVYPALANCIVPRGTFDRIRAKFGNICDSDTPDAAFLFRVCAVDDVLHHYDRALDHHVWLCASVTDGHTFAANDRAHGPTGSSSGVTGRGSTPRPIPGLSLGYNVMFHEYNLVRRVAGDRFPPIDHERYLNHLGSSLAYISDLDVRSKMRDILIAHGWQEPAPQLPAVKPLYKRILGPPTRPLRRIVSAVKNKMQLRFGSAHTAVFTNDDDGVRYLLTHEMHAGRRATAIAFLRCMRYRSLSRNEDRAYRIHAERCAVDDRARTRTESGSGMMSRSSFRRSTAISRPSLRRDGIATYAAPVDGVLYASSHLARVRSLIRIVRLLRRLRPDVVHSHIFASVIASRHRLVDCGRADPSQRKRSSDLARIDGHARVRGRDGVLRYEDDRVIDVHARPVSPTRRSGGTGRADFLRRRSEWT